MEDVEIKVDVEELKTVVKVKVKIENIEIVDVKARKTKRARAKIDEIITDNAYLQKIQKIFRIANAIDASVIADDDKITIKQRYDVPRLKKLIDEYSASLSTINLRELAFERLQELDELAELCTIKYTYIEDKNVKIRMLDQSDVETAYNILTSIKDNYNEHRTTFNTVLKIVSEIVKSANKLTTEDNVRHLKELREIKEEEERALEQGDYDRVSDETLKKFIKDTFNFSSSTPIFVFDKSSKHRAICFATLSYVQGLGLVINRVYLCGIDDNEEAWIHEVEDLRYDDPWGRTLDKVKYSVEGAMSRLFNCSIETVERAVARQGDILIVKAIDYHIYTEDIREKFMKYEGSFTEYDIAPSHTLISKKPFKVYRYKYDDILIVELTDKATLTHPSHRPIILHPLSEEEYPRFTFRNAYVFLQNRASRDFD